ncbi:MULTISPECIES: DUF6801 domain-containing protein [unclassified Crossiella]|uniref:DUF6801 domain-containing protein n=1 Tax=unclassified Crossiella TaxID=2620835 RepID=UPI001FFF6953|nr:MULTISPECIES: DUF6801 domain-containing protein [unclassified Crossiella]MCK2238537.1 5'-nucleotidase [Crossiella sp. S99.2]MCK2251893.1 5'-nucleotidase [Crossiella sp. S99.1]
MKMNNRSRLAGALATVTVGAMLTTAGVLAGAGTGIAAPPAELTLVYSCPFPLIGVKDMSVKITVTGLPEKPVAGQPTPEVDVTAVATVPADATAGLKLVSAATIEGKAVADTKLDNAGLALDLKVPMTFPKTPIPDSGPFDVIAKGKAPSFALPNPGRTTIDVGNFLTTLTPLKADGTPTGLGTFDSACTIKATEPPQKTRLYEVDVLPPGGTTTTTSSGTTTTSSSTTKPTSTTTSPSSTTTSPTSTSTTPPPADLEISYSLNGKSHIKKLNTPVVLGPGEFAAKVNLTSGALTGDLSLPKTKASFKLFGFIPTESVVELLPVGKTTGTFTGGVVKSNSKVTVRLPDIRIWGIPVVLGNTCQTTKPADIALNSGPNFNPMVGGTLTGDYEIPAFAGCGAFITDVVSAVTSGPGNTISLDLKKA